MSSLLTISEGTDPHDHTPTWVCHCTLCGARKHIPRGNESMNAGAHRWCQEHSCVPEWDDNAGTIEIDPSWDRVARAVFDFHPRSKERLELERDEYRADRNAGQYDERPKP